jgi:hypothetical protein
MLLKTLLDPGSYQPPIHAMDTDKGYSYGEFRGSEALLGGSLEIPQGFLLLRLTFARTA